MLIITLEGKRYNVKYKKNAESLSVTNHTSINDYPNRVGSSVYQNSTSSDKWSLTFAIHKTLFPQLKESLKKILINDDDAINDSDYGKLTHIVIVHDDYGVLKGRFDGELTYQTASEADISCSGTFVIHTPDDDAEQKDLDEENQNAADEVNDELDTDIELSEIDKPFLLELLDDLNALYDNIQNSAIIAAFNDMQSALNDAVLNYQKVMNSVKKILSLPGSIMGNVRGKIDFFKKQHDAIKNIIPNTFNQAKFNVRLLSFNQTQANRIPFEVKDFKKQRSGLKTVPLK